MSRGNKNRSESREPAPKPVEREPEAEPVAEAVEAPKREPVAPAVVVYRVAKGRSVTSKRGILDAGAVVRDRAFSGEGSLPHLVEVGIVEAG